MATGRVPTTANSPLTAKGDLFGYSTTQARVAVGNDGESLVADSSTSTGLRYTNLFGANKNKIINGDFFVNQRGLTSTTTAGFGHDRFDFTYSGGTVTYSNQTFTAGTAPVAGYEGVNFARLVTASQTLSSSNTLFNQKIEDVRAFAGQTITFSFWAKAGSGTPKVAIEFEQDFGSGGSLSVLTAPASNGKTLSTSWARYSGTVAIPSISGKTIGTSSFLRVRLWLSAGTDFNSRADSMGIQNNTIDLWGWQLEAGSVATAFQTATGTIQGELAACQRYYYRQTAAGTYSRFYIGNAGSTTVAQFVAPLPVTMRTSPTTLEYGGSFRLYDLSNAPTAVTSLVIIGSTEISPPNVFGFTANVASGLTAIRSYTITSDNSATAYIAVTAEL